MKSLAYSLIVLLAASGGAARGQSFSFRDEIPYPTAYRPQRVAAGADASYRAPIPYRFETREVGVRQRVVQIGVVPSPPLSRPAPATFTVVFRGGQEAQFTDGEITEIGGVPFRGLGFKDGFYWVMNLANREIARFRVPTTAHP